MQKMIIGGQAVAASTGEEIAAINPATGEVIDTFPAASKEDIEKAIDLAVEGQKKWAQVPLVQREAIMLKFADLLEANRDELATLECQESGKPRKQCYGEITKSLNVYRAYAQGARFLHSEYFNDIQSGKNPGNVIYTVREPLGVVACIVPFNSPVNSASHKIAPALMMGNAVLIKPPSDVALTMIRVTELLLEAGVTPDACQIITGRGSVVGDYLADSPKIAAISFTGSTEVGVSLYKRSAPFIRPLLLELGGNDPVIVREDADLDYAVAETAQRLNNAGQICCSPKRWIVHESVAKELTEKMIAKFSQIKVGDPMDPETDMGTLINEKAAIRVDEQVQHTVAQGAKILFGGERSGAYYTPTILGDVTADMDIAKDMEIFGPVFPIITYKTDEEAVAIANQSNFGLNGGVITKDISAGMKIGYQIQTGTVVVNGAGQFRTLESPFGGYKMSGFGRESVMDTMREFTQVKTMAVKIWN